MKKDNKGLGLVRSSSNSQGAERISVAVRNSILARVREHGHGIRTVAREHGLSYNEAVSAILHQLEAEKQAAFVAGYRQGRFAPQPPTPPAARRAA